MSITAGCMDDGMSLIKEYEDGRDCATAAATSLVGLGHEEILARIAEFREGLTRRKAEMALAGFSHDQVQAWEDGYIAGLFERLAGWLTYTKAASLPPQRVTSPLIHAPDRCGVPPMTDPEHIRNATQRVDQAKRLIREAHRDRMQAAPPDRSIQEQIEATRRASEASARLARMIDAMSNPDDLAPHA